MSRVTTSLTQGACAIEHSRGSIGMTAVRRVPLRHFWGGAWLFWPSTCTVLLGHCCANLKPTHTAPRTEATCGWLWAAWPHGVGIPILGHATILEPFLGPLVPVDPPVVTLPPTPPSTALLNAGTPSRHSGHTPTCAFSPAQRYYCAIEQHHVNNHHFDLRRPTA
jgi:hypothetical protein